MTRHIVVSYSLRHYTPHLPIREGIGNVAKTLHESIIANFPEHEIIYTDPSHMDEIGELKNVDWLFTVPRDLVRAKKKFRPSKTVMFTANESALGRFEVWTHSRNLKINRKLLGGHDGIYEDFRENRADFIICLGGWNSYVSFLRSGFSPNRIITTGIKYQNPIEEYRSAKSGAYVVWFMGLICVRKGILNLPKILKEIDTYHPNLKIKLVGFTDSKEIQNFILNQFANSKPGHTWINKKIYYGTDDWDVLNKDVALGIFPSREEGLPGCVIDLINLHIPVVYSSRSGLNFVNEELSEIDFGKPKWEKRLSDLLLKKPEFWSDVAEKQEKSAFFAQDDNQVDRIIKRLSEGSLWPSFMDETNASSDFIKTTTKADHLDLLINYRGPKLSDELKMRLLVMELDRHVNLRSAGFLENEESKLILSMYRRGTESHSNPRRITLFVVDEHSSLQRYGRTFIFRKKLNYFKYRTITLVRKILSGA